MAITPFADSPRNGGLGDRPYALIDWAGPASYTQMTAGAANTAGAIPTGGQAIGPSNFSLGSNIEAIDQIGLSSSGNYYVQPVQITSYNQGSGNTTWALVWFAVSTGLQVGAATALNNEIVRLLAFGPY